MRNLLYSCAACCALLAAQAKADFIDHPLPDHPAAMSGFHGTTTWQLSGSLPGGITKQLNVSVDYAVFAPGAYPRDLSNFLPYSSIYQSFGAPDPDDFLYAYQIYNNGQPGDPTADNLMFLSVGLQTNAVVRSLGRDPGFDPSDADIDAALAFLGLDGAKYFMVFGGEGHELLPGQFSMVFLLASPEQPKFESSYVFSGMGLSGDKDPDGNPLTLPSPVPTPAAWLAGALGLAALAGWKLSRRA